MGVMPEDRADYIIAAFTRTQRALTDGEHHWLRGAVSEAIAHAEAEMASKCIRAVEAVTELEGPMPEENKEAAKKISLEDHLRLTIRMTKTEAIENIIKLGVKRSEVTA